jgi:hypothetical protein
MLITPSLGIPNWSVIINTAQQSLGWTAPNSVINLMLNLQEIAEEWKQEQEFEKIKSRCIDVYRLFA